MFAQVTNPPIDALREKVVTSTTVYVGAQGNLLEEDAENCKVLKIENPILTDTDLLKIKAMDVPGFKIETLSICYYKNTDPGEGHRPPVCGCRPRLPRRCQHTDFVRPRY